MMKTIASKLVLACLCVLIEIVLSFAGRNSFVDTFSTTAATLSTHQPVITPLKMSSSTDNQISSLPSSSSTTTAATTTTVGFLGCGTIASAIATGLLTQKDPRHVIDKVYVTKRSEAKSSALTNQFQDKVVVTEYMQEIVNCSDLVFLCVLPEQVETVLKDLNFDTKSHQTLISLVSTSKLSNLMKYSRLPASNVYKMICLPAVAELEGTPLLVPRPPPPPTSHLSSLIATLGGGTCIECDNEEIMEAMMVTTCMMGSVYELMRTTRDFLVEKGVPAVDANDVVARQYWGITKDALTRSQRDGCREDSLDKLIQEQTPGGLNEQALRNLEAASVFDRYKDAMEAVLGRIQGKSDGSMHTK